MFRPALDLDASMLIEDQPMAVAMDTTPTPSFDLPPKPLPRPGLPQAPVLIVPVRAGGYALLAGEPPNREMLAVALDAAGLADVVRRWASGEIS